MRLPNASDPDDAIIAILPDGDIIVPGRYEEGFSSFLRLVRISSGDGSILWTKDYPVDFGHHAPTAIKLLDDSQVLVIYDHHPQGTYDYIGRIHSTQGDFISEVNLGPDYDNDPSSSFSKNLSQPLMIEIPDGSYAMFFQENNVENQCCLFAEKYDASGDLIGDLVRLDFFSGNLEFFGTNPSVDIQLDGVTRVGDHYIFMFYYPLFDHLFLDRIESENAAVVTDLKFNVISVLKIPDYSASFNKDEYGSTINENGETLLASPTGDSQVIIYKFAADGVIDFVYEPDFPRYRVNKINAVHSIGDGKYLLLGSGGRNNEANVVTILFDEASVPHLPKFCGQ